LHNSIKAPETAIPIDSGEWNDMKKIALSLATALVFFVAAAVAQSTPQPDTQGSSAGSQANPSSSQSAQPSTSSSSQGTMGQASGTEAKGEKKLKGCVENENGKYVLETKHEKEVVLTGQDISAHVGHMVTVHGTYQSSVAANAKGAENSAGAASTGSTASAGSNAKAGREFNVTSVEMLSDSCPMEKGEKEKNEKNSTNPTQSQ
jgi:hypothetical protein